MNIIKSFTTATLACVSLTAFGQEVPDTATTDKVHQIDEVLVTGQSANQRLDNVQISQEKLTMQDIQRLPSFMGEKDIIKSLQLLPGVKSENDASCGFQVRGGKSSQNLTLLDNAAIYQSGHLLGIFSSFNDNALSSATLFKGMIPAQYGDATSSVLTVNTRSGDMEKYHFGGTVGLLSIKAYAEGPIAKDKVSFLVTARRSYADLLMQPIKKLRGTRLYFYDINARVDWKVSKRDRLYVSAFHGRDVLGLKDFADMNWMNTSLTLSWVHYYSPHLVNTTKFFMSRFDSDMSMEGYSIDVEQSGFIRHYGINHSYDWTLNDKLSLNIGIQTSFINLCSAQWRIAALNEKEQRKAWENAIWINGLWKVTDRFNMTAGIRLNTFSVLGGSPYYDIDPDGNITNTINPSSGTFVKTYVDPEPRFSANWKITDNQSLKFGYSLTTQNIHAIRSNMTMPFDRYTMSSNIMAPERAHQWSLGYGASLFNGAYDCSLEGYFKTTSNVFDYRDGKTFRSEIEIERLLLGGKSRAYGMEFAFHKNQGPLTGWFSYTLSWVDNKIDGINGGNWYTASNDRRHDVTIVALWRINKRWDLSASWKYYSGQALTAPTAKYQIDSEYFYYYSARNNYRSPANHRLDVSASYTTHYKRHDGTWTFGIYNLYNQKNPFMVGFNNDATKVSGVQAYKVALFGIIPSVSYTLKY